MVRFIEGACRQSHGQWAGLPLTLLEWQRDFVMRLFGWRRADGTRRFRWVYLEIAKKNGKSTLFAALALYLLIGDREGAAEVHLNAFTRNQASIIFNEAARMIKKSPLLKHRLGKGVLRSTHRIVDAQTDSFIVANSADPDANDGPNASAVLFDELHRQKHRLLWDTFEYAGVARRQPLHLATSTAGGDEEGLWHEQRAHAEGVNAGTIPDWEFLGIVYRADPKADLETYAAAKAANPSLGHTIAWSDFQAEWQRAKATPSRRAYFLRVRFGIVTGGAEQFISAEAWQKLSGQVVPARRSQCYLGLDLSSRIDLSALVYFFPRPDGTASIIPRFWAPRESLQRRDRNEAQSLESWALRGDLQLCDGEEIDFDLIKAEIARARKLYDVRAIGVDQWFAGQLMQELGKDGVLVFEVPQTIRYVTVPTRELERLVITRQLTHDGNAVMKWCVTNAKIVKDNNDNVRASKSKSAGRIDGLAALVDAIAAHIQIKQDQSKQPAIVVRALKI